jgi:hypothetical protein
MSDIEPRDGLTESDRATLAFIDALRERGAVEVSVDGVYARFAPVAAGATAVHGQSPGPFSASSYEAMQRLQALLGQERE